MHALPPTTEMRPRQHFARLRALAPEQRESELARLPEALRGWVQEYLEELALARQRAATRRHARVLLAAQVIREPTREARRQALAAIRGAARPAVQRIVERLWARRRARRGAAC